MKKNILIILLTMFILTTGCGKKSKTLTCKNNIETNTMAIKNGKIIKHSANDDTEDITDEEWETLKNFYGLTGNETTEEAIDKLKSYMENIGYTCEIK